MSDDEISGAGRGVKEGTSIGDPRAGRDARSRVDAVFDVLADSRRRYALYCLVQEPDGVLERSDLAARIEATEEGTERDETNGAAAIRRDLHHAQLPKLAEAGVIDYDTRQGTVRYTGSPGLDEWVEKARKQEGVEVCSTDS